MNAVKMIKEKSRLTQNCKIYCTACRLGPRHNGRDINCTEFQHEYPEECVKIIEQWSKDCPKKTYLSKLLEIFPGTGLDDDGTPLSICPSDLGLKDLICSEKCINCWNQEWEV